MKMGATNLNADPLLAVDGLAGHGVPRDQGILLSAGNEHTLVPVGLHHNLRSSPHASPRSTPGSSPGSTTGRTTASTATANTSTT